MATPAILPGRSQETEPPSQQPVLEPGDQLSSQEFERRYARMPQVRKAELIEGIVYIP